MKTEDELLDLIAKTHSYGDIEYIKDYLAENVCYVTLGMEQPVIGKENVCAKIGHWFLYHRNFNVWVKAVKRVPTEKSMGYVLLDQDYGETISYVVIESEGGLITRYYEVNRNNTRRPLFQNLKEKFFGQRAIKAGSTIITTSQHSKKIPDTADSQIGPERP